MFVRLHVKSFIQTLTITIPSSWKELARAALYFSSWWKSVLLTLYNFTQRHSSHWTENYPIQLLKSRALKNQHATTTRALGSSTPVRERADSDCCVS